MMNPFNNSTFIGVVPKSDKLAIKFTEGKGEGQAMCTGFVSVRRNFKKQDEKYYPEDLIKFVVFGATANYVNNYVKAGDTIVVSGDMRKDVWVDDDGETHRSELYLHAEAVSKVYGAVSSDEAGEEEAEAEEKPRRAATSNRAAIMAKIKSRKA